MSLLTISNFAEPERFLLDVRRCAVGHASHHRFANLSGESRYTEVDLSPSQREADASVLRQPPFGNIQVGHDLDARSDGQGQMLGRRRHFIQSAVHAIADFEFVLERLKVNVARAVLYRLIKHQVYKL